MVAISKSYQNSKLRCSWFNDKNDKCSTLHVASLVKTEFKSNVSPFCTGFGCHKIQLVPGTRPNGYLVRSYKILADSCKIKIRLTKSYKIHFCKNLVRSYKITIQYHPGYLSLYIQRVMDSKGSVVLLSSQYRLTCEISFDYKDRNI